MAFINKMDILGANFYGAVDQIRTRLGKNAIILERPIGKEDTFQGIIDLFEMKAYIYNDDKGEDISVTDIPEDMQDDAELYRTELVEKICELDDDLMMMYLEGEEPSVEEMKKVLRKATCECKAVPVCCGSAYRNKGVQKLLDAILDYMPAPTDILRSRVWIWTETKWKDILRMKNPSLRWHSKLWRIRSSASWRTSAYIPVR